ncbi:MAG: 30S ribosomal protein S6 [Nitrospinota bacterium]|nr:30S ribosomal protein S6 [Nitrospinota bacterium]MDH5756471.1 30S ribosomal protein S6 [Nitrospinota bacterium]
MKEFEALYILKADLTPEETEKEVKAVEAIVIGEGGSVIEHSDWGKKRLAYTIAKQRYGQYVLFRFSSPSTTPEKMTRHFRYNENVLKGMIVRLDSSAGYNPNAPQEAAPAAVGDEADNGAPVASEATPTETATEETSHVQPE